MRLRQKVALGLRSAPDAPSPYTAVANGDLRLFELIAALLRIGFRMHKSGKTVLLILLDQMHSRTKVPEQWHEHSGQHQNSGGMAEFDPAQKQAHDRYRQIGQRG